MLQVRTATRKQKYLRMLISGMTGGGKTLSALAIAKGITNGGKVFCFDTENGRMDMKVGDPMLGNWLWEVASVNPESATTALYMEALDYAVNNNFEAIILDSLTHEWEYVLQQWNAAGGKWGTQWQKASNPHFKFVRQMLKSPIHIICTARAKMATEQVTKDDGKKEVVKLGLSTQQESNLEYDMDFHLRILDRTHNAIFDKTEGGLFQDIFTPSVETGRVLGQFLSNGEDFEAPKIRQMRNRIMELQQSLVGLELMSQQVADSAIEQYFGNSYDEELVVKYGKSLKAKLDQQTKVED